MPRPRPLTNIASGRPSATSYQSLTPRTPHSRSGRAEEGFTEIELEQIHDDDEFITPAQQQSVPLLSSANDSFPPTGHRNRGDDYDIRSKKRREKGGLNLKIVASRLPLVLGGLSAVILLVLIVLSVKQPDALHRYLGASMPSHAISVLGNDNSATAPAMSAATPTHSVTKDPHILSYENYTKFPLRPSEYLAECGKLNLGYLSHGDYWVPHQMGVLDVVHHDDMHNYMLPEGERTTVCKSSITYMLDGEVGLLADLALMAQAAALARERNRTFLVDDTYWNRGKWIDHFQDVRVRQPGPERGCRAPPPEELVACPRLARHWVINSRTAKFHFGNGFSNHYEDAYGHGLNRLKPLFDAAATSFEEAIRPNAHTAELIRAARGELSRLISSNPDNQARGTKATDGRTDQGGDRKDDSYIGVHIRRGDRKPSSFIFHGDYIPIPNYIQAAKDTWTRLRLGLHRPSTVYLASDSPSALHEFSDLMSHSTQLFSLARSVNPQLRALVSPGDYFQKDFGALEEEVRVNATTGLIVDFALISGMWSWNGEVIPDATVCGISSNVCKLSAVGLGWNRAFGAVDQMGYMDKNTKLWVDIDERGQVMPVWRAFELF